MAFPTPPPFSPTGAGRAVKKLQLSPARPREITSQSSDTSGTSAMTNASPQRPVMIQFTARRAVSELMRLPESDHAATCARAAARRR